jgi:formamidopyrimidine-DNA glycosylase
MLLSFDGGEGLVSHLGMTGKWIRRRAGEAPPSHVRATLELEDGHAIDYRDPRLFGRLVRGTMDQLRALPALAALGPDPLDGIDAPRLHKVLHGTRRSLKEALMDQRTLAGLGNIQVSEALHRAGLHPARPANRVSLAEVEALASAIVAALRAALDAEDSPDPITYVEEGGPNPFLVYDRKGKPCMKCRTPIQRIVQGGRSTFFCPTCQPRGGRKRGDGGPPRRRCGDPASDEVRGPDKQASPRPLAQALPRTRFVAKLANVSIANATQVVPDADEAEVFAHREALRILQEGGFTPMVGGAYALRVHTGLWRDTKDLDLFLRKDRIVRRLPLRVHRPPLDRQGI